MSQKTYNNAIAIRDFKWGRDDICYSISSHVTYAHLTLSLLLPSMIRSGIKREQIHVWVGGAKRESNQQTLNGILHFVPNESRGCSAFVEPVNTKLTLLYKWIFVMNDTMEVGPLFGILSQRIDETRDCIAASVLEEIPERCQTDLGVYKTSYLIEQSCWIMDLLNVSEVDNARHEGELYSRSKNKSIYGRGEFIRSEPRDVYGTGVKRIAEYYPDLDMIKWKANYGLDLHVEKI